MAIKNLYLGGEKYLPADIGDIELIADIGDGTVCGAIKTISEAEPGVDNVKVINVSIPNVTIQANSNYTQDLTQYIPEGYSLFYVNGRLNNSVLPYPSGNSVTTAINSINTSNNRINITNFGTAWNNCTLHLIIFLTKNA